MSEAHPLPPPGLIVELVTPLRADGRLDGESLARLVARVVPAADGLLAGSPGLGEALDLPISTRAELVAQVLALVNGLTPLWFGITGHSWEETRELAQVVFTQCRARHYPGPVFLADLPLWYHSNRGLPQACGRLLTETPLPLILLNLPEVIGRRAPVFKHRNLRTQVVKKLVQLPGVAGLVYRGEMRRFLHYHAAAAIRPGFAFYEADEVNFLSRPGAWGVVSAGAQLFPASWQRAARACLHPEEAADRREQGLELLALSRRLLEAARRYDSSPAALVKAALAAQGVLGSAAVAPGTPKAPARRQADLLAALEALGE